MPIRSFRDQGTEDVANQRNTRVARQLLPRTLHELAHLRLLKLDAARRLDDLAMFPSYRLEKLRGDRAGQYSIRINQRYRICFSWHEQAAWAVEIADYH